MKLWPYILRMSLSIIGIVGGGIFFGPIIWSIFLTNPRLNTLIIILTIGGLAYAFYQLFCLKKDCDVLEDLKQGQWSFSSLPQGYFLDPILSFISKKKSILDPFLCKGLADSLADRLENERIFPRYLIGLLVFLGLLGTFWGLSQTITSIAQLIQNMPSDTVKSLNFFNTLKESLHSPLAGMGTAFSSSLFGLGGSLLIGFLELQVGHAYARFLNETDLYLTDSSYSHQDKNISLSSSPLSFLQALLTRNIESIDALIQMMERNEKNERHTTLLLDKLSSSLVLMAEQNKNHQNLMVKVMEAQITLQNNLSHLNFGLDDESRKSLQNIERAFSLSLQNQRQDREEFLKKIRDEMRLIAHTIASVSEHQRLVG